MNNLTDKEIQELAREKQREYLREWRRNNPDKVREYNQRYREWRKKNPDKVKEYNQRYWRKKALEMLKEN